MTAAPATATDLAVSVRGLRKAFGERTVLDGIDLAVPRGGLTALIGPNGAGKSTLLRILLGIVSRDDGDVSVLGLDPARAGVAVRRDVEYLPGETALYRQMTGRQLLDFAFSFRPRVQEPLLRELQELFDLPLHRRIRDYSSGMKQKLAVIAALVPDVPVYLLDEPDRALDASVRYQLRDVLQRLHAAGKTILLSTHHLGEVEPLADRVEFLLGGRFVAPERVAEAKQRLQRRLRVRLRDGAAMAGATPLHRDPDGWQLLEVGDPVRWLQSLPAQDVLGAELGVSRLEDLYSLLLQDGAGAAST